MNKLTVKQVRALISADTVSCKDGVFTVRRGYFFRHGGTAKSYAAEVLKAIPSAVIVDSGDIWKTFRGAATTANSSHWFVKFRVGHDVASYSSVYCHSKHEAEVSQLLSDFCAKLNAERPELGLDWDKDWEKVEEAS